MTIKDYFATTTRQMATMAATTTRRAMMTLLVILLTTATTAWADTVTLTAESGEVTLQNGDVLTGTGGVGTHIKIAVGATGIVDIEHGTLNNEHLAGGAWYDLSGRKLSGKPTAKGLYIHNGKKRIIK